MAPGTVNSRLTIKSYCSFRICTFRIRLVKTPPVLQHPGHILFIIQPAHDNLPNTKAKEVKYHVQTTNSNLSSKHGNKCPKEEISPAKPEVSLSHHTTLLMLDSHFCCHRHTLPKVIDPTRHCQEEIRGHPLSSCTFSRQKQININ